MRRLRTLTTMGITTAILIGALGAGAAAAPKTKMTIVNGKRGKVDVCVRGREIKRLGYGKTVKKTVRKPEATVRFYRKGPGVCRGRLIAKRVVRPNRSVVVLTKRKPGKVLVFREPSLPRPAILRDTVGIVRNASDIGPAEFGTIVHVILTPVGPAAPLVLDKGESERTVETLIGAKDATAIIQAWAPPQVTLVATATRPLLPLHLYQWLLIGDDPDHATFVALRRPIGSFDA